MVNDEKIKDKITEADKKSVLDKTQELHQWLASNPNASKNEYENKRKELENIFHPISTKIYGQQG